MAVYMDKQFIRTTMELVAAGYQRYDSVRRYPSVSCLCICAGILWQQSPLLAAGEPTWQYRSNALQQ